ncbi:MAG: hypothetical protein ABI843_07500 [Dokdonella sp.]
MSDARLTQQPALRTRLREKLPEIMIEAASVVLALLLAQAFGVWRENQQHAELAAQARTAILAEVRENAGDLENLRARNTMIVDNLTAVAGEKPDAHGEIKVDMNLALLSEAAWRAALATGAIQYADYRWTMRVAKVYELQDVVLHAQTVAVDQLTDVSDNDKETPQELARRLLSRQKALGQMAAGLGEGYRELLEEAPAG